MSSYMRGKSEPGRNSSRPTWPRAIITRRRSRAEAVWKHGGAVYWRARGCDPGRRAPHSGDRRPAGLLPSFADRGPSPAPDRGRPSPGEGAPNRSASAGRSSLRGGRRERRFPRWRGGMPCEVTHAGRKGREAVRRRGIRFARGGGAQSGSPAHPRQRALNPRRTCRSRRFPVLARASSDPACRVAPPGAYPRDNRHRRS